MRVPLGDKHTGRERSSAPRIRECRTGSRRVMISRSSLASVVGCEFDRRQRPSGVGRCVSQFANGVDACSVGRKNWRVGVNSQTDLSCDIARLTASIARAAAATEIALSERLPVPGDGDPRSPLVEHKELCRQLGALRGRVARAQYGSEEPGALRAELATLVFFAKTLEADADTWRGALKQRIRELEQQRAAEHQERERSAAQRARLVRRRDALEFTIGQTAARMAGQNGGECRCTVPVFTLGEGLTVCSVSVSWPRRGFRFAKRWLVTLNGSGDDVLVRRE